MKKIGLYLDSEPYSGGTFQYNQSIIDALESLPKKEYAVYIVYTKKTWEKYLAKYNFISNYAENSKVAEYLSKVGKYYATSFWRKFSYHFHPILKKIYDLKCDLWIFPSQDQYSYQLNINSIVAIHDLMHRYEKFDEIIGDGHYKRREQLYSSMAKYASIILVDSECGKQQVLDNYSIDKAKICVLPYIAPHYIYEKEVADFDQVYQLPSKYIFYPAQFWEHKNHVRLFYALSKVKKTYPDIKLVLVGSKKVGYDRAISVMKELCLENEIIHLGYVEDRYIPTLYKRARALVMPTFFGPTNIPPLEAFALKCPVAISGIYGMKEQCKDAALYFDPKSVEEISEAIHSLWEDDTLCNELIKKGTELNEAWNQLQFNERFESIIKYSLGRFSSR